MCGPPCAKSPFGSRRAHRSHCPGSRHGRCDQKHHPLSGYGRNRSRSVALLNTPTSAGCCTTAKQKSTQRRKEFKFPSCPSVCWWLKILRGVLGQLSQSFAMPLRRSDDLHLLPVVGKFSPTIEADDVGTSQHCSRGAMCSTANCYRKAIVRVPATKHCIYQFCDHTPTFHTRTGYPGFPRIE